MKSAILITALGVALLSSAQAAEKVIYLSGATAFRGVEFSVLSANITLSEAIQPPGATGNSSSFSFAGTWTNFGKGTSYPIVVYASYSGSVEGQDGLLNGTPQVFNHLPTHDGLSGTFSHTVTLTYSDSYQNTTQFGTQFGFRALVDDPVAIQPFVFVENHAAHAAGIANMTDHAFRFLGENGAIGESYWLGNGSAAPVYLSGRNNRSGTRTVTLSQTGYGVNTTISQVGNGIITGVYPNETRGVSTNTPQAFNVGNGGGGWKSGGDVRADMNNGLATDPYLGYLSAGDARSLTGESGFHDWYLTYNGVEYTKGNVIYAVYPLWGYEHQYRNGSPFNNADADAFGPDMATAVNTFLLGQYCTDDFPAGIPLSVMHCSRTGEAQGLIADDVPGDAF
jgi:hypothetical protein